MYWEGSSVLLQGGKTKEPKKYSGHYSLYKTSYLTYLHGLHLVIRKEKCISVLVIWFLFLF